MVGEVLISTGSFSAPDVKNTGNNQPWIKPAAGSRPGSILTFQDLCLTTLNQSLSILLSNIGFWPSSMIALPLVCHLSLHSFIQLARENLVRFSNLEAIRQSFTHSNLHLWNNFTNSITTMAIANTRIILLHIWCFKIDDCGLLNHVWRIHWLKALVAHFINEEKESSSWFGKVFLLQCSFMPQLAKVVPPNT